MENINWIAEKRKVADLKEWPENPRKINKEEFRRLKERIKTRGFHDVIKVDTNGFILSGNQRKKALQELGVEEVTVVVPDRELTEEESKKIALESNIQDGEWDWVQLEKISEAILSHIGFTDDELKMHFSLNQIEKGVDDIDRIEVLTVMPPESTYLKEKCIIEFTDKKNYDRVKNAIRDGVLDESKLLELL